MKFLKVLQGYRGSMIEKLLIISTFKIRCLIFDILYSMYFTFHNFKVSSSFFVICVTSKPSSDLPLGIFLFQLINFHPNLKANISF